MDVLYHYSDDNTLFGYVQWPVGGTYIARIFDLRGENPTAISFMVFDDDVSAKNWLLDKLECPMFTLLAK